MSKEEKQSDERIDVGDLASDILVFSIGRALVIAFGVVQVLVIPRYLSVEGYGYWQVFVLYSAYAGILHLGFIDGTLLRWAGKELGQVGNEIGKALKFLVFELTIVTIPLGLVLHIVLEPPFHFVGLAILAQAFVFNLASFFMFIAQAVRNFRLLSAVTVGRAFVFLVIVVALFASGHDDYRYVILAFPVSFLLAAVALAFRFGNYLSGEKYRLLHYWRYGKENINVGIFVLLANFVGVLFLTVDRVIVSSLFSIEQFATYAFAVAVIAIAYTFVGAVSHVFFPYLSAMGADHRVRIYSLAEPIVIISWAATMAVFFPLTRLVEAYLPEYVASLSIIQLLLCTIGFGSLVQILHANYFKVHRKQRQYFFWAIGALALSAALNLIAIRIWGTLESVASVTLISFATWYVVNEINLKTLVKKGGRELLKGWIVICAYLGAFWFSSFVVDWFLAQTIVYLCCWSVITWVAFRSLVGMLGRMAKF